MSALPCSRHLSFRRPEVSKHNFPFSVLTNSLATLGESSALPLSDEGFMIGYLLLNEGRLACLGLQMSGAPDPRCAAATFQEKVKLAAECVLHIDHLLAGMQRLKTYEAKTNAMTRIGSNLSQVLPPPLSCE